MRQAPLTGNRLGEVQKPDLPTDHAFLHDQYGTMYEKLPYGI